MTSDRKRPPGPDQIVTPIHLIQWTLVKLIQLVCFFLPWFVVRALGRWLGRVFWLVDQRHRRICKVNLDKVFGDRKTDEEKEMIIKTAYLHFGSAVFETLSFERIYEANFLKYVDLGQLQPIYKSLEQGKGVLFCSAHYGNWELLALTLGYLRIPLSVMARPIDNPLVHKTLEKIRKKSGNGVIYKHRSVRKVLTALSENRLVGVVSDQNVHDHNRIYVPFFGHEAATTPLPASLSYKHGVPIVCGFAIPNGKKYQLHFSEPIIPDQNADKESEIKRLTTEMNRALERQIEAHPSYWLWMHKRYKNQPDGSNPYANC